MKKYIFIALVAIAALSSCAKESLVSNEVNNKEAQVFTATMEDGITSKVTFDGTNKCALWEVNDEISIDGHTYKATSAGASSTFTGSDATETTHHAYFPAGLYDGTNAILPANVSETWTADKFNMPMYAESSTFDLSFKNLCGVLKITVTNTQLDKVKCITVSSTNCATSGAFTVDANNAAVLTEASKTANTVTVTYTDAVTTDATGKVFYVAIPAQTYKNLSIAVSDGTTTWVMTTKADQDIEVARNTIYPINFSGSLKTTDKATATINSTQVDVKWFQLWKDGPKFAEFNVGATSSTEYGGYYCWGSSIDKDPNKVYKNGTDALTGDDDTAIALWGNNWRMPTKDELQELLDNCTVEDVLDPDNNTESPGMMPPPASPGMTPPVPGLSGPKILGTKFTGKGVYASNSVFLPAAGQCSYGDVHSQGNGGTYWSSTPNVGNSEFAYFLHFSPDTKHVNKDNYRYIGYSVRAVLAEDSDPSGSVTSGPDVPEEEEEVVE